MGRRKLRYSFAESVPATSESGRIDSSREASILSVGELTSGIRRTLESAYSQVAVRGEILGLSRPGSGHVYFTLKDDSRASDAQIAVVLWRDGVRRLRFSIEDGLRVVVWGRVGIYPPRGAYQLIASRIVTDGLGGIALAFERLKALLDADGLFAAERKRPLPFLPGRVGVITSPTGAAVQDILRSIYRRYPRAAVRVVPVRVQGEGSADEVVAALNLCGKPEAGVDVIILGRGGGGPEDLWTFNEEKVVRAVAACPVPVISAVGHEVDFTLSDFAADVRAQTPTHAGEMVVPDMVALEENLQSLSERLAGALGRGLSLFQERLHRLESARVLQEPGDLIERRSQRLDDLARDLQKGLYNICTRWEDHLNIFSGQLGTLNPLQVLQRGYSVVYDARGKVVRRAKDLQPGASLRILLGEGEAAATVDDHGDL